MLLGCAASSSGRHGDVERVGAEHSLLALEAFLELVEFVLQFPDLFICQGLLLLAILDLFLNVLVALDIIQSKKGLDISILC